MKTLLFQLLLVLSTLPIAAQVTPWVSTPADSQLVVSPFQLSGSLWSGADSIPMKYVDFLMDDTLLFTYRFDSTKWISPVGRTQYIQQEVLIQTFGNRWLYSLTISDTSFPAGIHRMKIMAYNQPGNGYIFQWRINVISRTALDTVSIWKRGYNSGFAVRPLIHDTLWRHDTIVVPPFDPKLLRYYASTMQQFPYPGNVILPQGAIIFYTQYGGTWVKVWYMNPK